MKNSCLKLILVIACCLPGIIADAQWSTTGGISATALTTGGSVGIGTSSPVNKLDIRTTGVLEGINFESNAGFLRLFTPSMTGGAYNGITQSTDAGFVFGGDAINTTDFGFVIAPWSSAFSGLRVSGNGNVGIGTASPDQKLTVNGKIKAEEIQVVVDVPADFVFEKEYKLLPLKDVANYVKANKHLPDMPDAQSIIDNGWQVGEMNNKLLMKIEELTLYVIKQNQEIEYLRNQNERLEMKVNAIIK